jgi:hypothetical protein
MMSRCPFLLLAPVFVVGWVDAFTIVVRGDSSPCAAAAGRLHATYDKKGHHISVSAMETRNSNVVDMERAKYCAENFSECSLEEIQQLRDST